MTRTAFFPVAALTGFVLASSSILHAGSLEPASGKKTKSSGPSVTTYATGLTNPRGLAFGPDGNLYVARPALAAGRRRRTSIPVARSTSTSTAPTRPATAVA